MLYDCSASFCLLGVLTKLNDEPKKISWLYNQLSVEGAMYLLHLVCIDCMFIKYIFS